MGFHAAENIVQRVETLVQINLQIVEEAAIAGQLGAQ